MNEYRITAADLRVPLLLRGHTESQVAQLLGDISEGTSILKRWV